MTTATAATIQEETVTKIEIEIVTETETEIVAEITEGDDVTTTIARGIVVVTDSRAVKDRDLLDDTIPDRKTRVTR